MLSDETFSDRQPAGWASSATWLDMYDGAPMADTGANFLGAIRVVA
jgi:hypothetical protein